MNRNPDLTWSRHRVGHFHKLQLVGRPELGNDHRLHPEVLSGLIRRCTNGSVAGSYGFKCI
jgi:hypothetical protein